MVLTGGLRALGTNWDESEAGVFTDRVGVLSNDFFRVLTSMDYVWTKTDEKGLRFTLDDRDSGETRYTATRNDLVFGANSQLRNIAGLCRRRRSSRMVRDFVKVWNKVMTADLF